MSDKELARVGQIASMYHSETLAGANEQLRSWTSSVPTRWCGPMSRSFRL